MVEKKSREGLIAIVPLVFLAIGIFLCWIVSQNGMYPTGSDTMYHIYRGERLYASIKDGEFAPLLEPSWYNGVQLMRYWAPVCAYLLAFCQFLAGGNSLDGYLFFVCFIFFFGALSWFYIGKKLNRPWFGAFIGILWFFMPNNLLALFTEGNLARSVIMIFLPLFLHTSFQYCIRGTKKYLWANTFLFALITLCHVGYAGMIALSMLIYLLIFGLVIKKQSKVFWDVIVSMLLGFGITGIYFVPSVIGGITTMDSSETMSYFFQTILLTLNPFDRMQNGYTHFYFGLAACIVALLGVFLSKRTCLPGFFTALFLLVCSTTAMYYVFRFIPGSQYLWMLRFISISLCMILYSLMLWKELRKGWLILLCALLIMDTVPSLGQIYGKRTGQLVEDRLEEMEEGTLIGRAKEITTQRLAVMDLSRLGSMGAYLCSSWKEPVDICFGAGWEAAQTKTNISQLNRAVENGQYLYLFDRAMELGNDTVLIDVSAIKYFDGNTDEIDTAAARIGYDFVEQNGRYRLYHLDTPDKWGTVTNYAGIAIGTGAGQISLSFPAIKEAEDIYIDHYSIDELKEYEIIYLNGFRYDDKENAENLIRDLGRMGVRIVILADGIPEDRIHHTRSFLGVTCNYIEFQNGFPDLKTIDGILYTDLFPSEYATWKTVYMDGLDEVWGTAVDHGFQTPFYGTVDNDNIVFVGFDLTRFYGLTLDAGVEQLLSYALKVTGNRIPQREIVPLEVTCEKDSITINSPASGVNTAIAYHDIFRSESLIRAENNLMVVEKGITKIELKRPYFYQGIFVSCLAIIVSILYIEKADIHHKKSRTK